MIVNMVKIESTDFQKLLFDAWIEFQCQAGRRISQKAFADYLAIYPALLSHYSKGIRSPRAEKIVKKKLVNTSGLGIYSALGQANPHPMLRSIERGWHLLSLQAKEPINLVIFRYEREARSVDKGSGMEKARF